MGAVISRVVNAFTKGASLKDRLILAIFDAIEHREPQDISGCCWWDSLCATHEAAFAMAGALRITAAGVEAADDDEEALEAVRSVGKPVRDEITGATTDPALRAAITGGGERDE